MNKAEPIKLDYNDIVEIKRISPPKKFSINAPLFYEGQIPVVAYLLLDGCIQLVKNKKVKKTIRPGCIIGLNELMNNSPAKLSALVQAESTICFLDKSTIQEILHNEHEMLAQIFKEEAG